MVDRFSGRAATIARFLVEHVWEVAVVVLVAVVAIRLGVFDWYTSYPLTSSDGSSSRLPNTFASIDHPFHISKERAVLDGLHDGWLPRWVANHQAGYPAEFYPLGADLVVVAFWALGLGFVPLEVVRKLVVIAVLFLPVWAYRAIARRDGLPSSVVAVAALLHLFLPGSWLGGGPDELLRMGMWPNVFAAYLMLPLTLWAADYLRRGSRIGLALAVGTATLAIYSNPRALIAVATALLAVGLVALLGDERQDGAAWRLDLRRRWSSGTVFRRRTSGLLARSAVVATSVGLLSSTLLVPLRANQNHYEFTRFVEFASLGQLRTYLAGAVPVEIIVLAAIGVVFAARQPGFQTRVLGVWLPLALLVILIAGWALRDLSALAQLEGPRLMPMLRLPTIFLAALTLDELSRAALSGWRSKAASPAAGAIAVGLAAVFVLTPVTTLSAEERGLPAIETTDQPAFTEIARSARIVEDAAGPEDRVLVVGSPLSEHAAFWIPALSGADSFNTRWVWHWRRLDFADRSQVADMPAILERDFLDRHGLTMALVATGDSEMLDAARGKPYLRMIEPGGPGGYAVLRVDDADTSARGPVSIPGGEVVELDMSRELVVVDVVAPSATEVRIAINAYPAWKATVNGQATPIRRSDDGYMVVDVPAGDARVELTYSVEPAVWVGRALAGLGVVLLTLLTIVPWMRSRSRPTHLA